MKTIVLHRLVSGEAVVIGAVVYAWIRYVPDRTAPKDEDDEYPAKEQGAWVAVTPQAFLDVDSNETFPVRETVQEIASLLEAATLGER